MRRVSSITTVVLVQSLTLLVQSGITASLALGGLAAGLAAGRVQDTQAAWLVLRLLPIVLVVILWLLGAKQALFRAMVLANVFLTIGLLASTLGLVYLLIGNPAAPDSLLLSDVLLMAVSNVLVFSTWYWIIDPPGIDESLPSSAPWDFLFPQRSQAIPQYEGWSPRYIDYLHLAFTTSVAFSPTDTLPLTRRAKLLMNLQAGISMLTIVFIAGAAINRLG
jgi:hypothetical protein